MQLSIHALFYNQFDFELDKKELFTMKKRKMMNLIQLQVISLGQAEKVVL